MLLLFLATRYGQRCSLESIALRAHATLWSLLYHELTLIIKNAITLLSTDKEDNPRTSRARSCDERFLV